MSDLVVKDNGRLWAEEDEESLPDSGALESSSNTCYGSVSVNDSSDVHVGTKYVADQIVIVLPKSDSNEIPPIDGAQANWLYLNKIEVGKEDKILTLKFGIFAVGILVLLSVVLASLILLQLFFKSGDLHASTYAHEVYSSYVSDPTSAAFIYTSRPTQYTTTFLTAEDRPSVMVKSTTNSDVRNATEGTASNLFISTESAYSTTTADSTVSTTQQSNNKTPFPQTTDTSLPCKAFGADHYFPLIAAPIVVNVTKVADGVCMVRRDQWGSRYCDGCVPFTSVGAVQSVEIHFIDRCDSFLTCSSLMKVYETDYDRRYTATDTNFLYNFVVGGDCRIYEGLGWDSLVSRTANVHIGIQLWDGQKQVDSSHRISEKQLYNLMLLLNVGRWCGKIGSPFTLSLVCRDDSGCAPYFPLQRNIRYLEQDKYMMTCDKLFDRDSQTLGRMFSACDGYEFQHNYIMCKDIWCSNVS